MSIVLFSIVFLLLVYLIYEAYTVGMFIRQAKQINFDSAIPLEGYSPIYNLPKISVDLSNPSIESSSTCAQPIRTNLPCQEFCNNDNAHELIVDNDSTISSTVLAPGRYCTLSEPVPCSSTWGILIWGLDSWQCFAKHPDIVGGPSANVPNFYFYNSDTLLGENVLKFRNDIVNFTNPNSLEIANFRDELELECNSTIDKFNMVRLGNSFKCVRDPCQTIPGTDSHWDGTQCVCGTNQINISGPLTPCVGANYISYGYDEPSTTDYSKVECANYDTPWSTTIIQPCPSPSQQTSTYGYSSLGVVFDKKASDINIFNRTSGFVKSQSST